MSSDNPGASCPICAGTYKPRPGSKQADRNLVDCPNCGSFALTPSALTALANQNFTSEDLARIAFSIRKRPGRLVTSYDLDAMAREVVLPGAPERIDNLVLYLADSLPPGRSTMLQSIDLRAVVGAETHGDAEWVVEQALALGYVGLPGSRARMDDVALYPEASLTIKGWERREELLRNGSRSRHAFMAMKFDEPQIDALYCLMKKAVAETGFELRTTNEGHKTPELIDNRMRVEIRTSRFLVCDLTHGNRGAYWEAGYAEGLGRPVIYVCEASKLTSDNKDEQPHFDTAHQTILKWSADDPAPFLQELKDMIRVTLKDEANQEDQDSRPG